MAFLIRSFYLHVYPFYMLINYLRITLRNIMKNKLFVFINVLGLGIAIALCIVAWLNWRFAEDWDKAQTNADKIYRIQFWRDLDGRSERFGNAPITMTDHIRQNIADVDDVVRYLPIETSVRINDDFFSTQVGYADTTFFRMFNFDFIHGNVIKFGDKNNMFISDELARVYFGHEDVVGELVTQINHGVKREFVIGAVFKKQPLNSSFSASAFTSFENVIEQGVKTDDWKSLAVTFLLIDQETNVPQITKGLQQYIEPQNKAREDFKVREFYLENFNGLARRSVDNPSVRGELLRSAMKRVVIDMPGIMAALLLLLACFNFTNTSIALSGQRLKEIGIRKVIGGVRKQLIFQFLGESFLLCFLGLTLGLVLAEFLVPAYDYLWGWLELDLSYSENWQFLLFLAGLLVLTAVIAGGYPAFYITSFEPVAILKGRTKFGGASLLTRTLLAIQFGISLVTIIFSIGFYDNSVYQKNYDLGYVTTGVISVPVESESDFNTYRDVLEGNADILQISGTKNHILNFNFTTVKYGSHEQQVDMMEIGDGYLSTMNIQLVKGRDFLKDSETDRKESVLVTEELVRQLEWTDDPIGKQIIAYDTVHWYVVGVVKDIYSRALFRPLEPMVLRYVPPVQYKRLVARVDPSKMHAVNDAMRKDWKNVFPDLPYNSQFIDDKMSMTIEINNNGITIFTFLGFFAVLMSATGLYTLVSLQILKRTKEIGVRKVLGASFGNIVHVISFEFLVVILIGSLLGGALGYQLVNISMDAAWEYYEEVGVLSFIFSVVVIFVIAFFTIGYKTVTTAKMNPVKTLRDE